MINYEGSDLCYKCHYLFNLTSFHIEHSSFNYAISEITKLIIRLVLILDILP